MATGRLGGKTKRTVQEVEQLNQLFKFRYNSMAEAVKAGGRRIWQRESEHDARRRAALQRAIDGNKPRLDAAVAYSDELVDEAVAYDQRLARRAQWRRRDEGEHCDSALLAQGDDQPFYKHTKQHVTDATTGGERVRLVVSTDSNQVPRGAAAAFIAAVRIAQQFVPLEVWWQGAWLTEDQGRGFVFHVPLVAGDMDFARLEYCIADETRDSASWAIMAAYGVNDARQSWNDCDHRATYSHMPGKDHFVSHDGVSPTAHSIACYAARWIGLDPLFYEEYKQSEAEKNALQRLPPDKTNEPGKPPTAEDIERQKK